MDVSVCLCDYQCVQCGMEERNADECLFSAKGILADLV